MLSQDLCRRNPNTGQMSKGKVPQTSCGIEEFIAEAILHHKLCQQALDQIRYSYRKKLNDGDGRLSAPGKLNALNRLPLRQC